VSRCGSTARRAVDDRRKAKKPGFAGLLVDLYAVLVFSGADARQKTN
jgi:hypothetical protein